MAGLSRALDLCLSTKSSRAQVDQKRSQWERLFAEMHIWVCVTQFALDASSSTHQNTPTHRITNTVTHYILFYTFSKMLVLCTLV